MKRHDRPPTWESRVRGLMLGLALGDAIGAKGSDVPPMGLLQAGVATQLAAWTVEGLLRTATRYGGYVVGNPTGCILHAYQRWATLRGGLPSATHWAPVFEVEGQALRGWLMDVPVMAEERGSSPATLKAILSGKPTSSQGCQSLLRGLPIAAFAGPREMDPDHVAGHAVAVAEMTHVHPRASASVRLATTLAVRCLREERSVQAAIRAGMADRTDEVISGVVLTAFERGLDAPCVPQTLERLSPDKTAASALAGGIYVALSFPDVDTVAEALEFAGWAPDGDSVAGVAGAFLGAVHGYEALPAALTSRLELGWVTDQLAYDLARQTLENQAGAGWKSDEPDPDPPADSWWDTKYPGV
jgi:ADP-ribosylglycohydrolase